jgi:membrane protein implicated in regulation of membrane protease activity
MNLSNLEYAILIGFVFLIVDIVTSSFVFSGFAIGAFSTAILFFLVKDPEIATVITCFTIFSLPSFFLFRRKFRKNDDTKITDKDINQY